MAIRLPDGSIKLSDGRIVYANSLILAQDLCEIVPLCVPPPAWPFVSGGGGGGGGTVGRNGVQGSQGPAGGGTGTQGPGGPQGFQGTNPGPQGNQGGIGPQGNQGLTGSGSQGAQGNQGTGGPQGNVGPQGNQGLTGSGAQGNQGNQGNGGPQGNQGNQGLTGAGVQGPQGNGGVQGNQGNQGGLGPQGSGVQGPQGNGGVQGNQGFQGPSGSGGALFQNVQENTLTTTDATPTVILSETIAAGSVGTFRVVVDARYDDGSLHASFVRTIRANREGGGALLGTENADYTDDESAALTATFTASGNDVQVTVIGVAATNITWKARMGRVILP
jgi:hypothetical protein